ncbi:trehalose 2-sulfotransferase [Actinomycetes bacterium M1A6_2h]
MSDQPRSYLVLASQRSGSTLLVESLRATGQAGEPQEFFQYLPSTSRPPQPRQWFEGVTDESILELLAPLESGTPSTESSEQWRDRILREGRSSNGVWGGKLMWNQTPLLVDRADSLLERTGHDLLSAVQDVVGDVVFVHVYRTDVVAQAVSMWRAVQTQVWRGKGDPNKDAAAQYHAGGIAHLLAILESQETQWRQWFSDNAIEPVEVDFADLAADTTSVTARVLTAIGLDPTLAPPPALQRQGNARSDDWITRFKKERVNA